jgi:osmotically-inducible protein OsmY
MAGFIRKGLWTATAGAAGAAVAYFFDPDRGRARRNRTKDQAAAALRRRKAEAEREARYLEGRAEGAAVEARGAGQPKPQDDVDVTHAVRQAFSAAGVTTEDVTIEAVDGVVTLRGQVASEDEKQRVEEAAGSAAGVREVQSWLHLPGQPAPNKAEALQAS